MYYREGAEARAQFNGKGSSSSEKQVSVKSETSTRSDNQKYGSAEKVRESTWKRPTEGADGWATDDGAGSASTTTNIFAASRGT